MKVLAGPRVDLRAGAAAALCRRLAGPGGEIVALADIGLRNPYRRFSAAEVDALRGALRGETGVVGYVCMGVFLSLVPGSGAHDPLVVVTDHVNLTWRSPLAGPNDERVGPRFPSMDGIYVPEAAAALGDELDGHPLMRGVVAGVADDRGLGGELSQGAGRHGWVAASSELIAPVIVAAHMGLRVAAVVVVSGGTAQTRAGDAGH